MEERWKAVPGCAGYEVSNWGRVRGEDGRFHGYRENRERWLVVVVRGETPLGWKQKRVLEVHRLVGLVWRRIKGAIGHLDGDYRNNRADNLVKCRSEHEARKLSGRLRYARGLRKGTKLGQEEVKRLREERKEGWTIEELAARYGVSHQMVSKICLGKAWREA